MFKINLHESPEYISDYIRKNGYWEGYTTQVLLEIFRYLPEATFVDIGANIGYFSLLSASKNIKTISFEPITKNYHLLIQNININNYSNLIKPYKFALSNINDEIDIDISDLNMGACSSRTLNNSMQSERVYTRKLDDTLIKLEYPLILKIDVEEMEKQVLKGAIETLKKTECLILEICDYDEEILDILKTSGFTCFINIGFDSETKIDIMKQTEYLQDKNRYKPLEVYKDFVNHETTDTKTSQNQILFLKKPFLNYCGMYNWTNDLPQGSKKIFLDILDTLKPNPNILEIGVYSGVSICSILDKVKNGRGHAIDNFSLDQNELKICQKYTEQKLSGEYIRSSFLENTLTYNVKLFEGDSTKILSSLENPMYDFIYVDASHTCLDTVLDIVLAWRVLLPDGILAIDDYSYIPPGHEDRPKEAVDYFLKKFEEEYTILNKGYRIFLKKINIHNSSE